MCEYHEYLGFIAGILGVTSFIPQVFKIYKEKTGKGVSGLMFGMMCVSLILWVIYGIIIQAPSIIVVNGIMSFLAGTILFLKIRWHKQDKKNQNGDISLSRD